MICCLNFLLNLIWDWSQLIVFDYHGSLLKDYSAIAFHTSHAINNLVPARTLKRKVAF